MTRPPFDEQARLVQASNDAGGGGVSDGIDDKLRREWMLAVSAGRGIVEEAVESAANPGKRLPEAGVALAAGTALGLLSRGRFGIGSAAASAFTASFLKQALADGGKVLEAASNAWASPENLEKHQSIVASTVGNFAVDAVVFGVGGAAGAKLSRIPLELRAGKFAGESTVISNPNGMHIAAEANWRETHSLLQQLKANSDHLLVGERFGKPAAHVPQKMARTAGLNEALGTTDIATCSALVVVDRVAGKQLLAHADHLTNPDMLRKPLAKLNLPKSEIYVLEGEGNAFSANIGVLGSAERVILALGNDPAVLKNVRFLRYAGPYSLPNLVVHRGKLYADASDFRPLS